MNPINKTDRTNPTENEISNDNQPNFQESKNPPVEFSYFSHAIMIPEGSRYIDNESANIILPEAPSFG